jgi:hypothetical protein
MLRRLLNIVSIVCLVLCVALMGMWVRSYYLMDSCMANFKTGYATYINSAMGIFYIDSVTGLGFPTSLELQTMVLDDSLRKAISDDRPDFHVLGFRGYVKKFPNCSLGIPYWFLATVFGAIGSLPWYWRYLRWRFSLRGQFIAITFLAVVLGMIAWLDRAWIGK